MASKAVFKPSPTSLLGRIRKLVDQSDECSIPGELLIEHVVHCDVTRQDTWTLNFNSVVEYANLDVRRDAVIAM